MGPAGKKIQLTLRITEVNKDSRREISALVFVRKEVVGHALVGVEGDVAHVLDVGRILALASEPDHPADHGNFFGVG